MEEERLTIVSKVAGLRYWCVLLLWQEIVTGTVEPRRPQHANTPHQTFTLCHARQRRARRSGRRAAAHGRALAARSQRLVPGCRGQLRPALPGMARPHLAPVKRPNTAPICSARTAPM